MYRYYAGMTMDSYQKNQYKTREISVEADITINELLTELNLSSAPILLRLNGEVLYPDDAKDVRLEKGDKLLIIPLLAGG